MRRETFLKIGTTATAVVTSGRLVMPSLDKKEPDVKPKGSKRRPPLPFLIKQIYLDIDGTDELVSMNLDKVAYLTEPGDSVQVTYVVKELE